jgi:hypothetical protein
MDILRSFGMFFWLLVLYKNKKIWQPCVILPQEFSDDFPPPKERLAAFAQVLDKVSISLRCTNVRKVFEYV